MDHQPFTRADVRNNRVAWDRTAAFGEGDEHTVSAFDRQVTMILRGGRNGCRFTLLQVLRHDHAHGVAETNLCQQVIQRGELHTLQLMLNVFWRDLCQFAAATQRVIEQTTPQANGVVALKVFQQLADFCARF
ncbi:Uncharacterised protein [Klebsiella pneumoniae]|nr:Uncharacterised protein [Klebsiella pneumoniae]